jgi:hypothetical protein
LANQVDVNQRNENLEGEDLAIFSSLLVIVLEFDQVDAQKFKDELHGSSINDCKDAPYNYDFDFSPSSFFSVDCLLAIIIGVETQQESFIVGFEMWYDLICLNCAVWSRVNGKNVLVLDFPVGFSFCNVLVINVVFAIQKASVNSLLPICAIKYIFETKNKIGLAASFALAIVLIILRSRRGHLRRVLWTE